MPHRKGVVNVALGLITEQTCGSAVSCCLVRLAVGLGCVLDFDGSRRS